MPGFPRHTQGLGASRRKAGRPASANLDDFVACYNAQNRHERKESERFKNFSYEDLLKRDKLNLDILTPRCPARRPLGPARLILRSQRIQVYAQGVKANVLFFDRKPAAEKPWKDKLWIWKGQL